MDKKVKTFMCHCCNKTFKTQKGFDKHVCEFQKRFVEIETHQWLKYWLKMKTVFKIKVKKDVNKEYFDIIHAPYYAQFTSFLKWCEEVNVLDYSAYLEYLKLKNYPMKMWADMKIYKEYMKSYIKNELPALANERSEKYLRDNNTSVYSISPNFLYFSLLNGSINNKYLKSKEIDVKKILDKGQLNDLRDLL